MSAREDRFTTTEHDAGLYEAHHGESVDTPEPADREASFTAPTKDLETEDMDSGSLADVRARAVDLAIRAKRFDEEETSEDRVIAIMQAARKIAAFLQEPPEIRR